MMANVLLLSKCSATKHPATVQSRILHCCKRLPPRPPSYNICRFKITARTTPSLIMKPPKASPVDVQFAGRSRRIWVNKAADAILKPLKTCGITLVIMPLLLMSCPARRAWAKASIAVAIMAAEDEEPEDEEPMAPWVSAIMVTFFILYGILSMMIAYADASIRQKKKNKIADSDRTSVLKLQVGLLGTASSLQRELQLIAEIPCTSTHTVESRVLTGATRALLCHPDYCISASTCVHVEESNNEDEGKQKLHRLYKEERAKFNEERRHNPASMRAGDYMVVTIFMVVRGDHKIPNIRGSTDLKNTLQKLESIPHSKIKALKVLWTPQAENKTLSEKTS